MVDAADATEFLKLGPDGLEVGSLLSGLSSFLSLSSPARVASPAGRRQIRNDAMTFESVRATCCASGEGLWYYEITVFTTGVMQVSPGPSGGMHGGAG